MKISGLEEFYGSQSKFYDLTRPFFLFSRRRAIKALDIKPNDRILDFACGTGMNIPLLLKNTAPGSIVGIDYSRSMLAVARRKYPGVKFIEGDIAAYDFDGKFDRIICTYSLSMVDEYEKAIFNAARILKEDGTFVILDFHSWRGIGRIFYPMFRWWLMKHGVDQEKPIVSLLKKYFRHVEEVVLNGGYNSFVIARLPLPAQD